MFAYDVPAENNGKSYHDNLISYEENQFGRAADALAAGSIEAVMRQENQVLSVQTGNRDVQVGDNAALFSLRTMLPVKKLSKAYFPMGRGIFRQSFTGETAKESVPRLYRPCLRFPVYYCDYHFPHHEYN